MVQEYERDIILPPPEFRDRPIPAPRTRRRPIPLPASRTKIERTSEPLRDHAELCEISIRNNKDPQLSETREALQIHIRDLLGRKRGLKFIETLVVKFEKTVDDEGISKTVKPKSSLTKWKSLKG